MRGYDATLVLGDVVGYGADPNEVIDRVTALNPVAIVRGNHDKVACGLEQAEGFNMVAKSAAVWTLETLTPAHREWLAALPEGPREVDDLIEICHGSPFDEDAYLFDELDALRALKVATRPLCFFGHTHFPDHVRAGAWFRRGDRARRRRARLRLRCGRTRNICSIPEPLDSPVTAIRARLMPLSMSSVARWNCAACRIPSSRRRRRSWKRGCQRSSQHGSRSDGRN